MKTLFQAILSISLSGSVIICVVLLARMLLRKAPRQMICLLWLLAGLRLLVPFSIESPFSLQSDQTPDTELRQTVDISQSPAQTIPQQEQTPPPVSDPGTIQVLPQQTDHMAVAAYVWAGVGACFLIYTFGSYLVLKNRVRDAAAVEAGIYESDRLRTAFILGYFAPKIYLPKGLPEENREFIVAHERAHLTRGDNWVKLLGFLCLALHWFNPLVWLAYSLLCR